MYKHNDVARHWSKKSHLMMLILTATCPSVPSLNGLCMIAILPPLLLDDLLLTFLILILQHKSSKNSALKTCSASWDLTWHAFSSRSLCTYHTKLNLEMIIRDYKDDQNLYTQIFEVNPSNSLAK